MIYTNRLFFPLILLSCVFTVSAHAMCEKVMHANQLPQAIKDKGYTVKKWNGGCRSCNAPLSLNKRITLSTDEALMPSGMLLVQTSKNIQNGTNVPYDPQQILFICDKADQNNLFEFYSTGGVSEAGLKYPASELPGAYFTKVKNVAIKVINQTTNQPYLTTWQSRPLDAKDLIIDDEHVYVPVGAFSNVSVELYKINSTEHGSIDSPYYPYEGDAADGIIAFKGPGINGDLQAGENANINTRSYITWPAIWSLSKSNISFLRNANCSLKEYTSTVNFDKVTIGELMSNVTRQRNFFINLSCEMYSQSGTDKSAIFPQVAMGFLVKSGTAKSAARNLNLVTPSGGFTYLLDNNYGDKNRASGVGIRIYSDKLNNYINLLSASDTGTGNDSGWYGYEEITDFNNSESNGTEHYSGNFVAELSRLPGQNVTAGKVNATLEILVSLQ